MNFLLSSAIILLGLFGMTVNAQDLYADFIDLNKRPNLVDSILFLTQMDDASEDEFLFPEMDLEEGWDNDRVNPYKVDVSQLPESININCSDFSIPVDQSSYVTSHFGYRNRFRRFHYGTDLKVRTGDTIRAAFSGKIRVRRYDRRGYGYFLVIRHNNGLETVYGHLSRFIVQVGDVVKAGQPIGLGGNTGRSTGSHLHFETRLLGKAFDPTEIFDFVRGDIYKDTYVFHVKSKGLGSTKPAPVNKERSAAYTKPASTVSTKNSAIKPPTTPVVRQTTVQPQPTGNQIVYHKVGQGDTLEKIAKKKGTSIEKLCAINGITPKTVLKLGRILRCS